MRLVTLTMTVIGFVSPAFTEALVAATRTQVVQQDGRWQLLRDGQPFFIRGAAGSASRELLAQLGGNSIRTWSADKIEAELDQAHKLGLAVTVGIWLRHESD